MFKVYILYSKITDSYYIGHTKDLDNRLERHNGRKVKSTKHGAPWRVVHTEDYTTKSEAYRRELRIKSYKGSREFRKLLKK